MSYSSFRVLALTVSLMSTVPVCAQMRTPASFDGVLPCTDCPGIRTTVTLREDGLFLLRRTWLRPTPSTAHSLGRWSQSGNRITLTAGDLANSSWSFSVQESGDLRRLEPNGAESPSTLARMTSVDPIQATMRLRGRYSYFADAAWFEECATGNRFPVGPSAANARLESEYGRVRKEPGEPVVASVYAHLATVPKVEGEGTREVVVVDALAGFLPGGSCTALARPLEGTRWILTWRAGAEVASRGNPERDAHLIFSGGSVSGSSGCNRLVGAYTLRGSALKFGPLAGTLMACVDEGMTLEQGFRKDLDSVSGYRVQGSVLELLGGGSTLARFRAAP
jgi:copper homeostasis protein (lipoprotein)